MLIVLKVAGATTNGIYLFQERVNLNSTNSTGIFAQNYGTGLGVTTGAGTSVTGGNSGILARNNGTGALAINANGDVTGTNNYGIYARNVSGTDLTLTTAAGTTVTGGRPALLLARVQGRRALSSTATLLARPLTASLRRATALSL